MSRWQTVMLLTLLGCATLTVADEPQKAVGETTTVDPLAREKAKSAEFFQKLDAEEGVRKLPSGLRIRMVHEGDGASPSSTDMVRVHYRGTFLDGKEFDSSHKRGQPARLSMTQVISCWTEGLQLMKTGGKATLYCPSEIAYGDSGRPPAIPAGATLMFDVELIEIVNRAVAPAMP